jgi:hypothetical protein
MRFFLLSLLSLTWEDFDKASLVTNNKANCITSLYRDATPFPAGFRAQLNKNELVNYVNTIINDEWQKMAKGQRNPQRKIIIIFLPICVCILRTSKMRKHLC